MVFNDVFDVKQDTAERPNRPIPSGAVSLSAAWTLGLVLCAVGVGLAALVGFPSIVIAVLIIVAVFAYDWLLKPTAIAPLAMGTCRFLNVCLGASFVESLPQVFTTPQVVAAGCLGIYIGGLTWFARREVVGENKQDLIGGTLVMNAGVVGLCLLVATHSEANTWQVVGLLVFILATINGRYRWWNSNGLAVSGSHRRKPRTRADSCGSGRHRNCRVAAARFRHPPLDSSDVGVVDSNYALRRKGCGCSLYWVQNL
jgi:4-hydroxybenzoate polyprenyltransferase